MTPGQVERVLLAADGRSSASSRTRRSRSRSNPGADRPRRPGRLSRCRCQSRVDRRAELRRRRAARAWAGATQRRTSSTTVAVPREPPARPSPSTCSTTCPGRRSRRGASHWTAALALEPDHVSAYALTLDDRRDAGSTDHLPPRAARRSGAREHGRRRTRIVPRTCTSWRTTCSRAPACPGTRSPTGRGRATRAATTSRTGRAGRGRRSVRVRIASTAPTRRWNAARMADYLRCARSRAAATR